MEYTEILYDVEESIATITLHRPDRMNAFTGTMMREMIHAFDQVDADDDVRAVIVTGSGERAFCAGADLGRGGDTFAEGGSDVQTDVGVPRDGGGMLTLRIFESTKPVIGAINGAAVGVGATMTLPMDIRLAADTARFGFVFARRGIVPEACSSFFLPRLVGTGRALELFWTGRRVEAEEAEVIGMVQHVVPHAHLREHTARFARRLVRATPTTLRLVKMAVQNSTQFDLQGMLDFETEAQRQCWDADGTSDRLRAYVDRQRH